MTTLLIIILIMLTAFPVQAQFAGGSGTVEDPYQVETLEHLQEIADTIYLYKHFIQVADIDASDTEAWNEGRGFEPIGSTSHPFTGTYDGKGHTITSLTI